MNQELSANTALSHYRSLAKPARAKIEDQEPVPGGRLRKKRDRFGGNGRRSLRRISECGSNFRRPRSSNRASRAWTKDRIASSCSGAALESQGFTCSRSNHPVRRQAVSRLKSNDCSVRAGPEDTICYQLFSLPIQFLL